MEMNEDLKRERRGCTFNIQEMTEFIDGGAHKTQQRKERERLLLQIREEMLGGTPYDYLSHKEKYEVAVRKSVALFTLLRRQQVQENASLADYRETLSGLLSSSMSQEGTPMGVHYLVFVPVLMGQAADWQLPEWLPRAWNAQIIGSYAQTELGHGTFIRGLETTATYDPASEQFVLHSPSLSAYKWWAGGLGQTANYCIVIAQLYTQGQCQGIHPFLVQIRDEETHMPLPGIKVGEIGSKMGLNAVNNGFLGFDHVRIPRTNMMMKNAQVLEDGTYVKSPHSKLTYGGMVFVRVVIVHDMVNYLAKAVTIAVRYSAVRRQGRSETGQEHQVLDYVSQQQKLFIAIATTHALRLAADALWDTFNLVTGQLAAGDTARLGELHAVACCLKALSTADTAAAVERCRRACGGHGYMSSSNLPVTYCLTAAACTYEGDNTVLLLQTARFLMKTWKQSDTEALSPSVAYLKEAASENFPTHWENTVQGIIRGFQTVTMRKVSACADKLNKRVKSGASLEDAWNCTSVDLVAAAESHCRVLLISQFDAGSRARAATPAVRTRMMRLSRLYALHWALETRGDMLQYTNISGADLEELQSQYEGLLKIIRPDAVGLVDAFDIADEFLQSSLGAFDGRVYERLMEEALKSPLNAEPVNQSFHKYLKPFMQGKL